MLNWHLPVCLFWCTVRYVLQITVSSVYGTDNVKCVW